MKIKVSEVRKFTKLTKSDKDYVAIVVGEALAKALEASQEDILDYIFEETKDQFEENAQEAVDLEELREEDQDAFASAMSEYAEGLAKKAIQLLSKQVKDLKL